MEKTLIVENSSKSRIKIEKMLIKTALERSNGKKNDAAQILGWGRNTLSKKMKEHGI